MKFLDYSGVTTLWTNIKNKIYNQLVQDVSLENNSLKITKGDGKSATFSLGYLSKKDAYLYAGPEKDNQVPITIDGNEGEQDFYLVGKNGIQLSSGGDNSETSVFIDIKDIYLRKDMSQTLNGTFTVQPNTNSSFQFLEYGNNNPYIVINDTKQGNYLIQLYDQKIGIGIGWSKSIQVDSTGNLTVPGEITEKGETLSNKYAAKGSATQEAQTGETVNSITAVGKPSTMSVSYSNKTLTLDFTEGFAPSFESVNLAHKHTF